MTDNRLARRPGGRLEHLLLPGTKTTLCGEDATLMNRYPFLTTANSHIRTPVKRCTKCLDIQRRS